MGHSGPSALTLPPWLPLGRRSRPSETISRVETRLPGIRIPGFYYTNLPFPSISPASSILTTNIAGVYQMVVSRIPDSILNISKLKFTAAWEIPEICDKAKRDDNILAIDYLLSILTISGSIQHCVACTSEDYMKYHWPNMHSLVLEGFAKAVEQLFFEKKFSWETKPRK
jgi:hypothetical protein